MSDNRTMTPSGLLIDMLENSDVDDMQFCFVIFKRKDGSYGYGCDDSQRLAESVELVSYAMYSLENDFKKLVSKEGL